MIKELKNKIKLASIIAPVYADSISLKPTSNSSFTGLTNLTIDKMISGSISLILIVVSLVFFFILIFGGLKWITSGGDEKKVAAARSGITNALIGLVVIFAAWAIMTLIGTIFGISILGDLSIPSFQ